MRSIFRSQKGRLLAQDILGASTSKCLPPLFEWLTFTLVTHVWGNPCFGIHSLRKIWGGTTSWVKGSLIRGGPLSWGSKIYLSLGGQRNSSSQSWAAFVSHHKGVCSPNRGKSIRGQLGGPKIGGKSPLRLRAPGCS